MHAGDQGDFLGLAGSTQLGVEGADDRAVARGHLGGHIRGAAHPCPPTPDDAPAAHNVTLAGQRSDADQRSYGLAVQGAQFALQPKDTRRIITIAVVTKHAL